MSGVIIVDAELLKETPKAFQQYVEEFFSKKTVLGKEAFVASTVLHWDWSLVGYGAGQKGAAPSHSVDLMRFKEGLEKGQSLGEWISKANGKYLWQFYSREPHVCSSDCD